MNLIIRNRFAGLLRLVPLAAVVLLLAVACGNREEEPAVPEAAVTEELYGTEGIYAEIKQRLAANPDDVGALYHLADLYDRNGLYDQAIETYRQVVKLKPDMGYAYFKMGTAYSRSNRPQEAVQAHLKAAEYLPGNAVVFNNLGIAYGKLNRLDEEAGALKKALEIRPKYASARFNLAITYLKQGNRQAARQEYETLKNIDRHLADQLLEQLPEPGH